MSTQRWSCPFCFPQSCSNWVLWHSELDGLIIMTLGLWNNSKTKNKGISGQVDPLFIFHLQYTNTFYQSISPDIACMEACHPQRQSIITGANFNQCYPVLPRAQCVPVTSWNQCCLAHEPCCYCQIRVLGRTNRTIGFVDEGSLWRVRHTSPHCDRLGVAGVHSSHFLIVAPVPKQEQMMNHRKTKQELHVSECRGKLVKIDNTCYSMLISSILIPHVRGLPIHECTPT